MKTLAKRSVEQPTQDRGYRYLCVSRSATFNRTLVNSATDCAAKAGALCVGFELSGSDDE